jgi:hypothetical protein
MPGYYFIKNNYTKLLVSNLEIVSNIIHCDQYNAETEEMKLLRNLQHFYEKMVETPSPTLVKKTPRHFCKKDEDTSLTAKVR